MKPKKMSEVHDRKNGILMFTKKMYIISVTYFDSLD